MELTPLSKSRYGVWEKCHWRAASEYIDKIRPAAGPAAALGRKLHALRRRVLIGTLNLDTAVKKLDKAAQDILYESIMMDEYAGYPFQEFEKDIKIGMNGSLACRGNKAVARAIIDRIIPTDRNHVVIEDLKTGRWIVDDVFERHLYVLAYIIAYRPTDYIEFIRTYPQVKQIQRWHYERADDRRDYFAYRCLEDNETINLWDWFLEKWRDVCLSSPDPNPGDQCLNWYGAPCYFLDKNCPISFYAPAEMSNEVVGDLPLKALVQVRRSDAIAALPVDVIAAAYVAVKSIQSGLSDVEKKVKDWCKINKQTFKIGIDEYGWSETLGEIWQKGMIIEFLQDQGVNTYGLGKAVNISRSSLNSLPKEHHHLIDTILESFVLEGNRGKSTFGKVTNEQ